MKRVIAYVESLVADLLFIRVCMFLWGVPFAALGLYFAPQVQPTEPIGWFGLVVLVLVAAFGLSLMAIATLGSVKVIGRATECMSDGGDIIGVLFLLAVVLMALPITTLLRAIFMQRNI